MCLFLRFLVCSLTVIPVLVVSSARGQGCPPRYAQDFDGVTPPALPADWTASQGMNVTGAPLWVTSTTTPDTPPNDVFSTAPDNILDNRLDAPPIFAGFFDNTVSFSHRYNLEEGFDGAVLEISTPSINGGAFTDVTDPAVGGSFGFGQGYNSTISAASQSPIAGRMAWSGNSNGYISVQLFLGFIGPSFFDNVVLRFRLVTDNSGASEGWRVDTFRWNHNECSPPSPTPTIPPTPSPTPTATPTPSPTVTPTATPSVTPTATVPPTATPSPSECHSCQSSPSPTSTPTATATPTATVAPTPSPTATPTPTIGPVIPAQALNISTRLRVETGASVAIGGFIITGTESKRVALRGMGPSLGNSGLSDVLADPTLELRGSDGTLLLQNDNWQDDPAQGAQLVALGLAPQNSNESGIVATLEPGAYTALVAGKNQTSGLALVEVYDADTAAASQLANISTRGYVRTGNNVMIGGFILGQGSANVNVAVRGLGPSLGQSGLTDVLADPTLELHDGNGALLVANDNWQDDPVSAAQLTAHGLAPLSALESGIFTTLPPGLFTAILAGKSGGVGLGLVEVYVNVHTLTVTNTADSGPGSLRDAIAAAQDGDTIAFAPTLNGQIIALTSDELLIDKSIAIDGPGPNQLTVQRNLEAGTPFFRIFHITPGHTVTIEGLTISYGFSPQSGGGVFNDQATLTLRYCAVESNDSGGSLGGGICNSGGSAILKVLNCTVTGNFNSGAAYGNGGRGGGIGSEGILTITDSRISGNSVSPKPPRPGSAGGIFSGGPLEITNSTISGNTGGSGPGGLLSAGPGTIINSTVSGNTSISFGGGISHGGQLTITNSTISGNSAVFKQQGYGGGIVSGYAATLTITNSTLSGNSADGGGGGIDFEGDTLQIASSILKTGSQGVNIHLEFFGTVTSLGYNLSNDDGGGFLTATGDQINTDPMLGPLQNNGGSTFTHELLTGSPAINAGDPNFVPPPLYDQRGPDYDRVVGGRIDIGSFEVQP